MGRTLQIATPEVFEPLLQPARYKGAYGGRAGTKSHGFADLAIDECLRQHIRLVCVREVQRSLEFSVKRVIEDKIAQYDLEGSPDEGGFRVLDNRIETPFDGVIIFQGMQDHTAESIKSLEGFNRAWVEEAQSLSKRSLELLRPTIFRVEKSELWFSWNPRFPEDPVDDLFRGNKPRKKGEPIWEGPPPNSVLINPSYRDNPWLSQELRDEINWDRRRDPEKYQHVWLGGYEQHSESRVFKNWKVEEFETPDDAMFYFGADWGYSIDPTVLVRCWVKGTQLFIDREVYKIGCEIDDIPTLFDGLETGQARKWPVTADSARPETISYLQHHGYPKMQAAIKGKDSVKEGIIFLQGYDIVVHPRCIHTEDELTHYSYKTDASGNVTPALEDKKNHVIDSLRYAVEGLRQPTGEFVSW